MSKRTRDGRSVTRTKGAELRIGTSGWNYPHWKEVFYPPKTRRPKWLEYYAIHFDTVELNATFYRLPKPATFDSWYQRTPAEFCWAVKASKYITHTKRLRDSEEPLGRLYGALEGLGNKLGPVLLQLPPSLSFDRELMRTLYLGQELITYFMIPVMLARLSGVGWVILLLVMPLIWYTVSTFFLYGGFWENAGIL